MWKFLIIFFIFVLLAFGAIYLVFHSHFLEAAAIKVSGSARADEIKDALIDTLLKGSRIRSLLGPENLLFWSPKVFQIPSSLFWLSDLSLKRNWSQKEIYIEVKERQPWLLWCLLAQAGLPVGQAGLSAQTGFSLDQASSSISQTVNNISSSTTSQTASTTIGNCYWLDDQGVVLSLAPEAEGNIIPKVFERGDRQELNFGQSFNANPQLVKNALEIIKEIKNSPLIVRRFLMENINLQELAAETNGPKLYFSMRFVPQDLDKIIANLNDHLDFKKLEYIDFRVGNRIYYK